MRAAFLFEVGDRYGMAAFHGDLAALYQARGDRLEEAERDRRESIEIHQTVGSRAEERLVRASLSALLRTQGRWEEANALLPRTDIGPEYGHSRNKVQDR